MTGFKINYYLQKVTKEKVYTFILISILWNKQRIRTTIKIQTEEKFWDYKKQRFKPSYRYALEYNSKLEKTKRFLDDYYVANTVNNKSIDKEKLKEALQSFLEGKSNLKKVANKTFLEHFKDYINDSKSGKRLTITGKPVTASTLKSYNVTYNHLNNFVSSKKYDLSFDNINEEFYTGFVKYLSKKGLTNNGQSYIIKVIKSFMHSTLDKELHHNTKFIKILRKNIDETTLIALSADELTKIEKLDNLSNSYDKIRDCFLVQVYTGLRYSDLTNLKPENINLKEKIITLYTIKTQDPLIIPISNRLEQILIRYDKKLLLCSNQKYNKFIKEICRIAEIDTPIQITKYIGKVRIDETKPKYELISSHTGRRTFITLTLKKGILPEMVMKVSGHKTRSSFQKYVRITQEEAVNQVQKAWEE
ncbi:MAG: site-specific integrase [Bacteroidetes bacterium]|nr:MAG: site-specific integrase [Bacteroidota bacterium]